MDLGGDRKNESRHIELGCCSNVHVSFLMLSTAALDAALAQWTISGLRTLARISREAAAAAAQQQHRGGGCGDGSLGWTSKPRVFAICARRRASTSAAAVTTAPPAAAGTIVMVREHHPRTRSPLRSIT